tara:strand:- start:24621 stop:25166 length:546 start_codon:yes stop_codon:yes gene_type:complete
MHISKFKKYYFIDEFNPIHLKKLDKNINLIWRCKHNQDNFDLIRKVANFCKLNKRNLLISNNIKLALKLNCKGVYISAFNKSFEFAFYKLKKNFKIIGSAHNLIEANIKLQQNVSELFIAPVFKDKNRSALGIYKCKYLRNNKNLEPIALGGINEKNLRLLKLTNFVGFAGIELFKKKGPK